MSSEEISIRGSAANRLRSTANLYGFEPQEFVDYVVGVINGTEGIVSKQQELLPLEAKVDIAKVVISSSLSSFQKLLVVWSGLKQSTLLVYLVKTLSEELGKPIPKVLFVDHYMHYDETLNYVRRLSESWKLDLTISKNESLVGTKHGDLVRIGNLPEDEREEIRAMDFRAEEFPFSLENVAGSFLLTQHVVNEFVRVGNFDGIFVADDPLVNARSSSTFVSREQQWAKIAPLLLVNGSEAWTYARKNNVPLNPLYVRGDENLYDKYATHEQAQTNLAEEDEYAGVVENLKRLGYA